MAMEEKGNILDSFGEPEGSVRIARYLRIPNGAKDALGSLEKFLAEEGLGFPLVLKPDFGQRGQGVEIVNDWQAARRWVDHCEEGFLAQEFITGLEFGVHWAKFPNEEKGTITSLCSSGSTIVVSLRISKFKIPISEFAVRLIGATTILSLL